MAGVEPTSAFPTATSEEASISQKKADLVGIINVLQSDIDVICNVLKKFGSGKTPPSYEQVPYVEGAARILVGSAGFLNLKTISTLENGEESTQEVTIDLATSKNNSRGLLAQLTLYLLLTRGRLSKKVEKSKNLDKELQELQKLQKLKDSLSHTEHFENKREKELFLASSKLYEKKSVERVYCKDPEFSLRVLQVLAPNVEDLEVTGAGPSHLKVLCTMSKLRRLQLSYSSFPVNDMGPFEWSDQLNCPENSEKNNFQDTSRSWIFDDIPMDNDGVVWLDIALPRQVLYPFIALHRRTLRELIIHVELPYDPAGFDDWRQSYLWICLDLPERMAELVQRYRMESLRILQLHRHHGYRTDDVVLCDEQQRALRRVLGPAVEVRCNRCG